MVALVIAFPEMVLGTLDQGPGKDPADIQIQLPPRELHIPPPPIFAPQQ